MTTRQIELIEDSWDYVITNTADAARLFYERLFSESPHLKALFKSDMREQERKLISLITFAVRKLRNIEEIVGDVKALGTRHHGYGVKAEHYNDVALALLWTLEQGLGSRWNDEVCEAWTTLYGLLAETMRNAPATVASSPVNGATD